MKKFLLIPVFFLAVRVAFAVDYSLPVIKDAQPSSAGPAGWVANLYQFSLMAAGILGFGAIVYAGFRYTLQAGNPSAQGDAKDQITQALLGLLLLLGAYLILNTINPNLTKLEIKGLTPIKQTEVPASPPPGNVTYYKCTLGGMANPCFPSESACRPGCGNGGTPCVGPLNSCP